MSDKILCIYHGPGCTDGLGAVWAVHRALGEEVEFVAAQYGDDPPNCTRVSNKDGGTMGKLGEDYELACNALRGRDVLIVDFSYPLATLRAMAAEARSVLVLDHHKTAQEDLAELPPPAINKTENGQWKIDLPYSHWIECEVLRPRKLAAIFDMERSGAGLAWDYLHPNTPRPRIIDLIEDRELERFRYGDESRAFHAVLASYDWTDLPAMFLQLDEFEAAARGQWVPSGEAWSDILREGHALLRAQAQLVAAAVRATRRTIRIAGHVVPVANVPGAMASDAGHLLCCTKIHHPLADQVERYKDGIEPPFSATYYDGADGRRHFSLRSPEGGADVGQIAKRMAAHFNTTTDYDFADADIGTWNGGGHHNASGFDAPIGWEGE